MAEEVDLEKCNFQNIRSFMTVILTLDRVKFILMHISGRGLLTHQILSKLENFFVDGWMYGWVDGQT